MSSEPGSPSDDLLAALRDLGAATVHEAQGGRGAVCSAIKPIDRHSRLAGRALTVDAAPADNLVIHLALQQARSGDVLVIDAKGYLEAGPWGDVLTEAAMVRGVAGLVIDGAVRDAASIEAMKFPVFCRGLSIKGTGKNQPGKVGQTDRARRDPRPNGRPNRRRPRRGRGRGGGRSGSHPREGAATGGEGGRLPAGHPGRRTTVELLGLEAAVSRLATG